MPRNKTEAQQARDAQRLVGNEAPTYADVRAAQERFERWRENDMPAPVRMRYQSSGELENDMRILADSYLASFYGGVNGDGWTDKPSCPGWWWFVGVLIRGRQRFIFESPAALNVVAGCRAVVSTSADGDSPSRYTADSYIVKGPRGLSFDSTSSSGLWRYIVQPLMPNAKSMSECFAKSKSEAS